MSTPLAALLSDLQAGDVDRAFARLYDQFGERLRRLGRSLAGAHADDANQEVLLAIYRALPQFRGDAEPFTWCYRIAVRVTLRYLGRQRRQPTPTSPESFDERAAPSSNDADHAREVASIRLAMTTLPWLYRVPLTLSAEDGRSASEIAAVLGLPLATVWTRLHRARKRLAEALARVDPPSAVAPAEPPSP